MKFLVLGATGMAGHVISLYLKEQGHEVTAFSRKPFPYCKNITGDASNHSFVVKMLKDIDFDVIINCIGVLNQFAEREPANAVYLNGYLPHLIADTLRNTPKRLIHMSTDCVFSGKKGSYDESSFRDGETFYDRTKAIGEIEDDKNLTFRNSIIGPDIDPNGIGLFNWFMRQNTAIFGYSAAIWTGVTTITLAKAMETAAQENLVGLYHLVNNTTINKFELTSLFNRYFKDGKVQITPSENVKLNKSLVNHRTDFSFQVPTYKKMISEMKDWVEAHQELYPHYAG